MKYWAAWKPFVWLILPIHNSSVLSCAASGCGLPPGPYGLLGAAEGLSYLAVLGFAGAGVGARVNSGGRQGLQGALAVPETLAYGALAGGLMVLASQVG